MQCVHILDKNRWRFQMSSMIDWHRDPELDLGSNHELRFVSWAPDRELNPQYGDNVLDVEHYGAIITHLNHEDELCEGYITFDSPTSQQVEPNRPKWIVESWDPLTISPSILCECGDHGFIRKGKWVVA
jgi:hypothetical protein